MDSGILSERALDLMNRAGEVKRDVDFCNEGGGLSKEIRHLMEWLGDQLRAELQRDSWEEPEVVVDEDGVSLYLFSPTWRRLAHDDYVAFSFRWPNLLQDPPCVQLYLPDANAFEPRNALLARVRPKLKRLGFTDYYEPGDPDPCCPLWKDIRVEEFHRESGFDLDSFVAAIADGFRGLMEIEPLVDDAFRSLSEKLPVLPSDRRLKTVAFVDTEYEGSGLGRELTQLAIVNVAYDAEDDAVVGVLEEYCMDVGKTLDETAARGALERADFVVAHNAFAADRPLLARYLPGTEKKTWLCSYRGIGWKELLGVESESLETVMGKTGLRYEQDHAARADARDLKRLLALKHRGRTFLGRLLDGAQAERGIEASRSQAP